MSLIQNHRLIKSLKKITEDNFPECILNLNYRDTEEYRGEDQTYNICSCGKNGLVEINHFIYYNEDNQKYIPDVKIGSVCIFSLRQLQSEINNNNVVLEHLNNIVNLINTNLKKECARCKEKKIRNNYNYKNSFRKDFCNNCIIKNDCIRCLDCNYIIKIKSCKWNNENVFKLKCYKCFMKSLRK